MEVNRRALKVRTDYVTNSSSSSFVISRNNITRGRLLEVLLEIANKECEYYYDDERYTWDDICGVCVANRYHISEATPAHHITGWNGVEYQNDYIIDNESCIRYHWDAIEDVLDKYEIPWRKGYCD